MRRVAFLVVVVLACFSVAAKVTVDVRGLPKPAPARVIDEATKAKAMEAYSARCVICHGPNGEGDGPSAAGLVPKPRRFADALWQASVTDEQLKQVIVEGGRARKLSPLMLGAPDLKDKPEVLDALVAWIRSKRAPDGTAKLTFGTGPQTRTATSDAVPGGAVRFDVLDVPAGVHPVVVTGAAGEHCRASANVVEGGGDINVVCERLPGPKASP